MHRLALSLIAVATLSTQRAHAEVDIDPAALEASIEGFLTAERIDVVARIAKGTVQRARRAVSFGPEVGASFGYLTAGDVEIPISAGLGLVLFKVPIAPSTALIKDVIRAKLKERLIARIKAGTAAMPPADEVARLIVEIYQGIHDEIVAELSVRARRLERPRLGVHVEGVFWPRLGDGEGRLALLLGAGRIAIGPTVAVHAGDGVGVSVGGEIDFHITFSKGPRAHPLILFVRGEYGATSNVDNKDVLLLGGRVMFDLI